MSIRAPGLEFTDIMEAGWGYVILLCLDYDEANREKDVTKNEDFNAIIGGNSLEQKKYWE